MANTALRNSHYDPDVHLVHPFRSNNALERHLVFAPSCRGGQSAAPVEITFQLSEWFMSVHPESIQRMAYPETSTFFSDFGATKL